MTLIIIIAALLIEQFWQGIKTHHEKNYFGTAAQTLLAAIPEKVKSNQWLFLTVLLIVPFILVCLVHVILLNILGGLPAMLFDIAVLLICVSLKPNNETLEAFLQAQHDQDQEKTAEAFYELAGEQINNVEKPNSYITRLILLQNSQRWFATLFYFALLGPAGVVLYRSIQEYLQEEADLATQGFLQKVLAYMDWPVSRLLAFTFCLAGSFDDAFNGWKAKESYSDKIDPLVKGNAIQQSNQIALLSTGCAAISHDVESETHNDTAYVRAMQGMLTRSIIIWCSLVAVLTLLTDIFI